MRMLPICVAALTLCGNIGNSRVADVAELVFVRQRGNAFVELFVADVADVAADYKTKSNLEIRRKLSDNKSPKPPNLEVI